MVDPVKGTVEGSKLVEMPINEGEDYYQKLIVDNLTYIERQCANVCAIYKRKISSISTSTKDSPEIETESIHVVFSDEINPDTLVNDIIDRLTADDYKVLREFRGHSKLTTYIGTIISNLTVDLIRKQKGRNRARDRAKAMGPIGEILYELIFEKGFPAEEAYEYLKENHHIKEPLEEIETMIERIRGRKTGPILADSIEKAEHDVMSKLVNGNDPEKELTKKQKDELAKRVLSQILSELSSEEKFIIRMRFPLSEDEDPKDLSEIGKILGISEKAVDSRIRRILTKCKERILKYGLSFDDFIDVYA
jgi:RNA polymerase sigma factor (sigma-70 family)